MNNEASQGLQTAGGAEREAREVALKLVFGERAIIDFDKYPMSEAAKHHVEKLEKMLSEFAARCANEARLEALEQAARVCNDVAQQETIRTQGHPTSGAYEVGSRNCAAAIRALKAAPLDQKGGPHAT